MPVPPLPAVLGLLSDPLRWQLVGELARSDHRVGELVQLTGVPQNLVSYHLAQLRRAGLVKARRSSADGRDVYYCADMYLCRKLLGDVASSLHPGLAFELPAPPRATAVRTRRRVLFLCTGNSARSQIAEAFTNDRAHGVVVASSAGSHPKVLHPDAVRVMAAHGVDISGCATKPLARFARSRFDRVITLCDKVREVCPEFVGSPTTAHWSIADPAASGGSDAATYPAFEQVAEEIEGRVAFLLADLGIREPERTHRG